MVVASVCAAGVRNYVVSIDLCDVAKFFQGLDPVFSAVWLYVVVVPQRLAEPVVC